jgi:hypothetical protein
MKMLSQKFADIKTGARFTVFVDGDDVITVPAPLMTEWGKGWVTGIFHKSDFSKMFREVPGKQGPKL